ncbi:hypothetical protein Tco_0734343 [Tanacetum coccineum]
MRQSPKTRKHVLKQELADLEMIIDKGDASSDTLHKRAEVVKSIQEVDKLCAMEALKKQKSNGQLRRRRNSKYYHGSKVEGDMSRIKSWDEIVDKMGKERGKEENGKERNLLWSRYIKDLHAKMGKMVADSRQSLSIVADTYFWEICKHETWFESKDNLGLIAREVKKDCRCASKLSQRTLTRSFRRAT